QFPALSDDGQVVVFSGNATNLVVSPAVPLTFDEAQDSIYRWNAASKEVALASQSSHMSLGNADPSFAMSGNGALVAFEAGVVRMGFFIAF
ncbi:MAG TPA: hypothetical protein VLV56_07025, partial [Burkholderiales bacterium]|nr:hypothetical protein [Burkholderiales bacterium]